MNDMTNYIYIGVGILAVVILLLGVRYYLKNKSPKQKKLIKSGIDIDNLLSLLGGNDNILEISSSMSKVTTVLKDSKLANVEEIKRLGASGIVQNENKLSMIFGKISESIESEMKAKI